MKYLLIILTLLIGGQAMAAQQSSDENKEGLAILAGGCFWCLEPPFDNTQGVLETVVGYTGGTVENPSYEQIGTGTTSHREAIAVHYDPDKVDYATLLKVFFENIDPFDAQGQYVDKGPQYTTAVYYRDEAQKQAAQAAIAAIETESGKKVATVIEPAATFYPAEEYHQDYYKKNPLRYGMYKKGSGR